MIRRQLDLNPEDYAVHYRTRRWSAALIVAKTLRWLAARTDRFACRSDAATASVPRGRRGPALAFRSTTGSGGSAEASPRSPPRVGR